MTTSVKGPVPLWRWALWWACLGAAMITEAPLTGADPQDARALPVRPSALTGRAG